MGERRSPSLPPSIHSAELQHNNVPVNFLKKSEIPDRQVIELQAALAMSRAINHNLKESVIIDDVSGLKNRKAFIEDSNRFIEHGIKAKKSYLILAADLDNFKEVNDSFGHAKGDEVLKVIGDVFINCLYPDDEKYRTGGDEFIGILADDDPSLSAEDMQLHLSEKFNAALSDVLAVKGLPEVGISIGIARWTPGSDWEQTVDEADKRAYDMKAMRKAEFV